MEGPGERILYLLEEYWQNKKRLENISVEDLLEEKRFLEDQLKSLQRKRDVFLETGRVTNEIKKEVIFYQRITGRSDSEKIKKILTLYHLLSTNDEDINKLLTRLIIPRKNKKTLEYIQRLCNKIVSKINRYISDERNLVSLLTNYSDAFLDIEEDTEKTLKTLLRNIDIGLNEADIIAVKNALQYEKMESIKEYRRNSIEVSSENVLDIMESRKREINRILNEINMKLAEYHELKEKVSRIEKILSGDYKLLENYLIDPDVLERLAISNGDIGRYQMFIYLAALKMTLLELRRIIREVIGGRKKKMFLDFLGSISFTFYLGDTALLEAGNLNRIGKKFSLKDFIKMMNPEYENVLEDIITYLDSKVGELSKILLFMNTGDFRRTITNIVNEIYKKIRRAKEITEEKEEELNGLCDSIVNEMTEFVSRLYMGRMLRHRISPLVIDYFKWDISSIEISAIETILRKISSRDPLKNLEAVMIYKKRDIKRKVKEISYLREYTKYNRVFENIETILGNISLYFFFRKDAGEGI